MSRTSVRPTALGWKALAFFALLLIAFIAAPYQNLTFLLLAFLSALGGLNLVWTIRNVAGLRSEVAPIEPFPAGASAAFRVGIDAGGRRRFDLTCVLDLGAAHRGEARAGVLAGAADLAGEFAAMPRGVHAVRGAWIASSYPLGLLCVRRRIAAPSDVIVHPAPASVPNVLGGGATALASAIGGAAGSDQPSGVRDFRAGDEVRDVHWRATARRGRPVVTEWDASPGEGVELVLDRRADDAALEDALSLVAALALAARDTKERLTLHTQGLSRTFGPGHAPWDDLLRALAAAERLPASAPPPPPAARTVLRLPVAQLGLPQHSHPGDRADTGVRPYRAGFAP